MQRQTQNIVQEIRITAAGDTLIELASPQSSGMSLQASTPPSRPHTSSPPPNSKRSHGPPIYELYQKGEFRLIYLSISPIAQCSTPFTYSSKRSSLIHSNAIPPPPP